MTEPATAQRAEACCGDRWGQVGSGSEEVVLTRAQRGHWGGCQEAEGLGTLLLTDHDHWDPRALARAEGRPQGLQGT